jgi:hypothetical protein
MLQRCLRHHGVEGGFVQFFGNCDPWSWQHRHAVKDGNPEAWKVVCGWQIWHNLLTTSTGGDRSAVEKARGRSPIDMPLVFSSKSLDDVVLPSSGNDGGLSLLLPAGVSVALVVGDGRLCRYV